jgi:2-polyprenyl-3-methyl-5-hydroxy-6-metoxy-1,4-benzoquinol methylase
MAIGQCLTERQSREQKYYDEYVRRTAPRDVSFTPVDGDEKRPWNPYWHVSDTVRRHFKGTTDRLLDFGCGPGNYSIQFAHIGYEVFGFDISPANVETAGRLADQYGLSDRAHFQVGVAEQLDYPDRTFDIVVGIDILHHVEIRSAIAECFRVLKPGGLAIFKEPVEAPVFDRLRNTRLGRAVRSKDPSFERHITEDERKLTPSDVRLIKTLCSVDERRFRLLSRLETLIGARLRTPTGASRLEIFDRWALDSLTALGTFAGDVVMICRGNPHESNFSRGLPARPDSSSRSRSGR